MPERNSTSSTDMQLPVMTLREVVMFPRAIVPLFVGRKSSITAVEQALEQYNKRILLVAQKEPEVETPEQDDLFTMGAVCKILQLLRLPDGTVKVLFEGQHRAYWRPVADHFAFDGESVALAEVQTIQENDPDNPEARALVRTTQEAIQKYSKINKQLAQETLMSISSIERPGRLADVIMPHLKVEYTQKQAVLEVLDPVQRLEQAYALLEGEIEVSTLERQIKSRVKDQMQSNQRDYYLNEQLKAIKKEMGQEDDPQGELDELLQRLQAKDMPDQAREKAEKEIKKLRQMPPSSAEYTVVRNYIDWILDLPWNELKETTLDLQQAAQILDEDHYGLDKPKERILEYLAVQTLVEKMQGSILCFVGPPGVGKTSLSKSIARATDRDFVRLSLGGVRDEAEIRGHRRTYVGAMPGKIIQSLKRAQSNNPVFCLDEVDKMSMDFRGDPSSALLEVLDPEQNVAFNDHYLDLDYDLSHIFFITTANYLEAIPAPLRDRMEIIKLSGYLETEKLHIGRQFLLPKQLEKNGLDPEQVSVSDGALLEVIRRYTREAGVRNMERQIAAICRKLAKEKVEGQGEVRSSKVTKTTVGSLLGVPEYRYGEREKEPQVGVATGLAWTEMGGELLLVEVALMPGTGKVEITGKIGDVMQESARAALSYIRSRSDLFGLRSDFYEGIDVHVHVPEGATPKDGPSAGITLATSLISALLHIPVRHEVAMTGEITLRGRVLPIGGLREKLLAAHRGLIQTVLIPKDNEKDLKEVPESIRRELQIVPVEHMDEVLPLALVDTPSEYLFSGRSDENIPLARQLRKEESLPPTH
ncbi:MAG: endopeptidase La [Thermodesulfobacteriota bacterium]